MLEIAPGIKFIRAEKDMFPYCHSLLIESDLRAVIETGTGEGALARAGIDCSEIDLVIYSHYHKDHTWGNHLFPKARVMVHRLDYPPLVDEQSLKYYTGFFEWERIMGSPRDSVRSVPAPPFEPMRVDAVFAEGDVIDFGHTRATVLHIPGHTPGHCGFYFEREGLVFGGDVDLASTGPWYGDYLSNLDDFEASIQRLVDLHPKIYCCSHRRPIRDDIEARLMAFATRIKETENKLLKYLKEPASLDELAACHVIYPEHPHPYLYFWERRMIEKHLERMVKRGQVEQVDEKHFRVIGDG